MTSAALRPALLDRLDIRAVTDEEYRAYVTAVIEQFGEDPHPADAEHYRPVTELDRTLAAFDGGRIVGTAEVISFRMPVPGGEEVRCAGVTAVGVRPSHRRQGLLTALMRRQLDDVHAAGEPVAALYASEAPIYGRFGYGPAAPTLQFSIDRPWAHLRTPVDVAGRVELVEADEAIKRCPSIHDRHRAGRPGMMSRSPRRWQHWLGRDEERHRGGHSKRRHAVFADRGYAVYRLKRGWSDNVPDGTLHLMELVATDPEAYAVLWQFCFGVDLMARVEAHLRPPDDPLPLMLDNVARLRTTVGEPLYVRLVDVGAALAARRYSLDTTLLLEVDDSFCPWNTGTWRLETGAAGATCVPTDQPADLRLGAQELGAVYLGGIHFTQLAAAGRIVEESSGALERADLAFTTSPLPWNAQVF